MQSLSWVDSGSIHCGMYLSASGWDSWESSRLGPRADLSSVEASWSLVSVEASQSLREQRSEARIRVCRSPRSSTSSGSWGSPL
eukprot:scaffold135008_cov16-Prasinocladus_malaysianus.AAC.1